jgi:chemotaxis protein methyltransferase CheR
MMRVASFPASVALSAFPEGPGFPVRTGPQTTGGRFHGISFSASSAAIPVPRVSGRLESLHFRGRADGWAPERRPHSIARLKAAAEIRLGDDLSCEDGMFAFELLRSAGLEPARYRMAPLIRRLPACLRALRVPNVTAARELLAREPHKQEAAIHALLIGTSSFFRDEAVFRHLGESVIPELVARQPRPKVWSAACSNGMELYSVAMLLAEHGALGPGCLLGSDCRGRSIAEAERGIYPAELAMPVPRELAARYLIGGKTSVAVAPAIHAAARWECRDLLETGGAGPWDMIFCRNLAIYLEAGAVDELWRHLAAALAPSGVLVVGKAEKPRLKDLTHIAPCIYRKTSKE